MGEVDEHDPKGGGDQGNQTGEWDQGKVGENGGTDNPNSDPNAGSDQGSNQGSEDQNIGHDGTVWQ